MANRKAKMLEKRVKQTNKIMGRRISKSISSRRGPGRPPKHSKRSLNVGRAETKMGPPTRRGRKRNSEKELYRLGFLE